MLPLSNIVFYEKVRNEIVTLMQYQLCVKILSDVYFLFWEISDTREIGRCPGIYRVASTIINKANFACLLSTFPTTIDYFKSNPRLFSFYQ